MLGKQIVKQTRGLQFTFLSCRNNKNEKTFYVHDPLRFMPLFMRFSTLGILGWFAILLGKISQKEMRGLSDETTGRASPMQ